MKNYINTRTKLLGLFLTITFLLQACSPSNQSELTELEVWETSGSNEIQSENEAEKSSPIAAFEEETMTDDQAEDSDFIHNENIDINQTSGDLTNEEIAGLIFMREEEKLAKDVYLGLYELWGLPIFQNIASSEQTHTDAVKGLLDAFGIEDPADNSPTGVFTNQDLQNMYDQLMAAGAHSLDDALKVGAAIEEIDILDLKEYLQTTQNGNIRRVYENLLRGSENHLRAFTSNLEKQTDETYQPQYMSQEDYDAILASSSPRRGRDNSKRP